MKAKRRVLLYGQSLILGSVAASLGTEQHLELISLAPPFPAARELVALEPDVIIFDLDAARPEAALALLQARPHLLLIGVDANTDQMVRWSGRRSRALSMQDLVQAIGAPEGKISTHVLRVALAERLGGLAAQWGTWVPTRRTRLGFVLAAVTLVACLVVVLSPAALPENAPLTGAAVGRGSVDMALAFVAGAVVAGLAFALWPGLWRRRR